MPEITAGNCPANTTCFKNGTLALTFRYDTMIRHSQSFAVTLVVLAFATPAFGQIQHDHDFSVYVPPSMSIRALRTDQSVDHPETSADITMRNSMWWARTASATGSTVKFSTDTCFINQQKPDYLRDVRLHTPRLFGTAGANWDFDTHTDQTDYANGDDQAMVQISGDGPGIALIFLEVTFITGNTATLAGGDYQVTVVGTITAN